ncbi:MAG: hypothetical protein HWE19_13730, partial [Vibrionaceae bacterium]|nr:hypothetical protein [Vibrionaceae bacterium]
ADDSDTTDTSDVAETSNTNETSATETNVADNSDTTDTSDVAETSNTNETPATETNVADKSDATDTSDVAETSNTNETSTTESQLTENSAAEEDKGDVYEVQLESELDFVAENQTLQLNPSGFYNDGTSTSMLDKPITWHLSDSIASIDESGMLKGIEKGQLRIWFSFEGLQSNEITINITTGLLPCGGQINDTSKTNAAGYCLKVVEGYEGDAENKLFTASPSIKVMEALGYTINDSRYNSYKTYGGTHTETRIEGEFARFRYDGWDWNNTLGSPDYGNGGQLDRYCANLAELQFLGRTNWRRATRYELYSLAFYLEDLTENFGWPGTYEYWTSTPTTDGKFYSHHLISNTTRIHSESIKNYASCVSDNG